MWNIIFKNFKQENASKAGITVLGILKVLYYEGYFQCDFFPCGKKFSILKLDSFPYTYKSSKNTLQNLNLVLILEFGRSSSF